MSDDWLPTLDALQAAMKGRSATAGWDVLASYDINFLNEGLATSWKRNEKSKEAFTATGSDTVTDKDQVQTKYEYNVQIDRPTLKFDASGGTAMAELTLGLEGSVSRTKTIGERSQVLDPWKIEHGTYVLQVRVPIVSEPKVVVAGSDPKDFQKKENEITIFDRNATKDTRLIKFNFNVAHKHQWVLTPDTSVDKARHIPGFEESAAAGIFGSYVAAHFDTLDYSLAEINNEKPDESATLMLRPEAFIFACYGHGDEAVLCIYMKVANGGSNGSNPPTFALSVDKPVPRGYRSSIIIRHELIRDEIKRALTASFGESRVKDIRADGESGFKFGISLDRSLVRELKISGDHFGVISTAQRISAININLLNAPLSLTISVAAKASWDLSYESGWVNWTRSDGMPSFSEFGGLSSFSIYRGAFTLNFKTEKGSIDLLSNEQNALKSKVMMFTKNDIKISPKAQDIDGSHEGLWENTLPDESIDLLSNDPDVQKLNAMRYIKYNVITYPFLQPFLQVIKGSHKGLWENTLPDGCKSFNMDFDDITINIKAINFLLTKNIFGASNAAAGDYSGSGLTIPHDLLLVGYKKP